MDRYSIEWKLLDLYGIAEKVKKYKRAFIYGAGMVGRNVYDYLYQNHAIENLEGFLQTEREGEDTYNDINIFCIYNVQMTSEDLLIVAAKRTIRQEMLQVCRELKVQNTIEIDCFDDRTYDYYSSIPEIAYPTELKAWYQTILGVKLNLKNPGTFNEKINWMKIYDKDDRKTKLADKYLVREYVKRKIGESYLIPLLGVWDSFEDIDFDELPHQFVLKCSHGCGWNVIVTDKSKLDIKETRRKFEYWMKTNYAFFWGFELQYRDIKPRILAEEYIENKDEDLYDYKFWCHDGKVDFIMYLSNRQNKLYMDNFSTEWELLPFTYDYPNSHKKIEKPDNLMKMIKIAEDLAEGFAFSRVDLYRLNDGCIKFGEITFTPASGVCHWTDENVNRELGKLIKL